VDSEGMGRLEDHLLLLRDDDVIDSLSGFTVGSAPTDLFLSTSSESRLPWRKSGHRIELSLARIL
jgi:hypothetical protein